MTCQSPHIFASAINELAKKRKVQHEKNQIEQQD